MLEAIYNATLALPDFVILTLAAVVFGAVGIQINIMHMSAIGLLMALILIFDNPFRGDTSVSLDAILDALKQ